MFSFNGYLLSIEHPFVPGIMLDVGETIKNKKERRLGGSVH